MLHNFMERLKDSRFKGQKYKPPKPDPETVHTVSYHEILGV